MFGLGKKKIKVHSVFSGDVSGVDTVPDPVFSQRMLGDGFAVTPADDAGVLEVLSPAAGTLSKLFKTLHAFAVTTDEGLEILVHIGLETVVLKGEGFEALAAQGDRVEAGTPIVRVDAEQIRSAGTNLITPVVFTKGKQVSSVDVEQGPATGGDAVCTVTLA